MTPQTIISIITSAARAMGISPRAVPEDPASSETHQLAVVRRCVVAQLTRMECPDSTIRAALSLSTVDFLRHQRIGLLLSIYPEDARIHQAIAAAVPGAFSSDYQPIPVSTLITAAAICGGIHIDEIRKARSGRTNARDFRSAALLIAARQGSAPQDIASEFRLSSATNKLSMIKNAISLSTVDARFALIIHRIIKQATLVTA
jgi:hypothetical protein